MNLRPSCFLLFLAGALAASSSLAAQPNLKAGVRLALNGSKLQGWAAPEIVDWNNDGANDVVVGHFSGVLDVYLNRGMGQTGLDFERSEIVRRDGFAERGRPVWAWRFNKANCVCPGAGRISPRVLDWDGDGKKDLIIGDGRGAQIRVWRNIGADAAPIFSTHHLTYLPPDGGVRPYHETVQPFVADWNGDGLRDLITGRNRGAYVYLNQGAASAPEFDFEHSRLGAKIRGVFPPERLSPVVVDWDGDGRWDLLVGSQRGEVWFARNVGSHTRPQFDGYARTQAGGDTIRVGSEARIAVADLDGDGRTDLLVGANNGVVWFFQSRQPNPIARSRHLRVQRNRSVPVKLVGTDDAGRPLQYTVVTQPKHGKLSGAVPELTFSPDKDFVGRDQFDFRTSAGDLKSAPTTVSIVIEPVGAPPTIATQPADELVAVGQPARFRVVASGQPPFSYQWNKNGKSIPGATTAEYVLRETKAGDNASFRVTVKNTFGSVSSRAAALQVKSLPTKADDSPVVGISYKSAVVEPATAGILTLTRTGDKSGEVIVRLASRRGHDPVVADVHYIPVPSSVTLKPGQTTAEIRVAPIDDTLVNGTRSHTFLIVPNPAYRVAKSSARMTFLDDDCPHIAVSLVTDATPQLTGEQTFRVTAQPAPRRDTVISYSVSGTAISGEDFEALPGQVTIPAGRTSATIVVKPYRQSQSGEKKTVTVTLPLHRFTFFDFYRYLTASRSRRASVQIASTDTSPPPPKESAVLKTPTDPGVEELRGEVARLGWIVFSARSNGRQSDFDLFMMRPDGSQLRNVTNTPKYDEYSARVSPNGDKMLYRRASTGRTIRASDQTEQDVGSKAIGTLPPSGMLVVAKANGSEPRSLGSDGGYAWATWGPKGDRFACLEQTSQKDPGRATRPNSSHKIVIRDAETLNVITELPSSGIHSQAIWSPDGKRICGPADIRPGAARLSKGLEYSLGVGKMVSVEIETGKRIPLAQFPDWYPVWATDSDGDWFQGGAPQVLHSANNYGVCPAYYAMLWRSGLDRKPSQLVFAEYQKNVWGGCTSPDDKYAVFVIGGETWPLQGKMAIIRLADAPLARGRSTLFHEVLADYFPNLKKGPVLDLTSAPAGFDPHWTGAEIEFDTDQLDGR